MVLLNNTAWMLATDPNSSVRNGAEAVDLAQRALKLSDGRQPAVLGTLAAAYAEAGKFHEAAETAQRALDLATRQNKPALTDAIRAAIAHYQAKRPFRETPQATQLGQEKK
jgi:tetratricopeptide (TPR) repeat protein